MSYLDTPLEGLAIVGLAGRFPQARTLEAFWDNLRTGTEAIAFFTDQELEAAGAEFPRQDPRYVKARGHLDDADQFDASFFGLNPKEAEVMDPQHRVFLECAWEALETAGYDPEKEEGLIGVFAGASMNTYLTANLLSHPELVRLVGQHALMLANDKDYLPTRVSYKLNLRGPSLNVQTGCSTSLVAVCLACQHLLTYQCDLALAGGVSIASPRKQGHLHQEGGIYSPDGHCRAFDARAQGTVAGEGAGVVVLKRLNEALTDGDQIFAVIKGFATNNDGAQKGGFTAPSEEGQAECIALAQAMAGVEPESIGYVEAHGTGTPLGDPIEVAALTRAFRAGTNANGFCALGSVKTHLGHLDAAAGIAGLITATLALHHRQIPPTLHFETPNPKIDFATSPFHVNTRLVDWPAGRTPRRAGVSSFGIGGTNAHAVLEEAPAPAAPAPSRSAQLLVLSAKTGAALETATAQLATFLKQHPDLDLADAAHTLQRGRRAFTHRRMLVCRDLPDAIETLQTLDPKRVITRVQAPDHPPVVFMFPGQGAQRVNMGLELYRSEPVFREQVDLCVELLQPPLGLDLRTVLYPADERAAEAREHLAQTGVTQPALFVIEYALAKLWMSWGIRPQAMIGHSIGEYVAACLAGVMSLKDALALVAARGRLMQQQPGGAMIAVRLPEDEALALTDGAIALAAVNGPNLCVLSGPTEAIQNLLAQLLDRGVACHTLETSHAFHSPMMEPIVAPFTALVKKVALKPPRLPYLSNVSGDWITPEQAVNPVYYARHLRQTVRLAAGVGELLREPDRLFLEIGPGQTLSTFVRQQAAGQSERLVLASLHHAQAQQTDVSVLLHALGHLWLAGAPVDWKAFYAHEKRRRVRLPTYPFERKRCWIDPARPTPVPALAVVAAAEPAVPAPAPATIPEAHLPAPAEGPTPSAPALESPRAPVSPAADLGATLKTLFGRLSGLDLAGMGGQQTFVEMGFDSLFLAQASQAIEKEFGVRLPFNHLIGRLSTFDLLAEHLGNRPSPALPGHAAPEPPAIRPETDAASRPVDLESAPGAVGDGDGEIGTTMPLTEAQREIWFAAQMGDAASCAFNQSVTLDLHGALDVEALRRAVQRVVDRHEALRVTFAPGGDVQHVHRRRTIEVPIADLSSQPEAAREEAYQALLAAAVNQPFDLVRGPLVRVGLVQRAADHHALVVTVHHLVCDGGSLGVLIQELGELYSAERDGAAGPAGMEPAQQFSQFALEQHRLLQAPERATAEAYWLAMHREPAPALDLPTDRPRPPVRSFRGGSESLRLERALSEELKRLSSRQRCTLFTTLLAGYYVLLHRLSGQPDVVVGLPMTGRAGAGSERLIGHCVNFLPLRLQFEGNPGFADFLARVRGALLDAYDHQNYTFGSLVQKLNLPRDPSRMPLVSVMFNLDWVREPAALRELAVEVTPNPHCHSNFELSLNVVEAQGELELQCHYNADLFTPATIQRWFGHYRTLLAGLVAQPELPVGKLPILSEAERRQLLVDWNGARAEFPAEVLLHQLFEAQAQRTPNAVAVRHGHERVTYAELDRRANQLARQLRRLGVGPEDFVGLCTDRDADLVAGLLGILKAGGAFVPIDTSFPKERIRRLLEETQAKVLVTQQLWRDELPATSARVLCLDAPPPTAPDGGNEAAPDLRPHHAAYVMFTSGSTGRPKGVVVEHRNAVALMHWAKAAFEEEELGGMLAATSIAFDLAVFEIFAPLSWGGTLVLADHLMHLPNLPARQEVRLVNTVPSALAELLAAGEVPDSVRTVALAGEFLSPELVRQLYALPSVRKVYDLYGPTENTTYCTWTLRRPEEPPRIGRPLPNTLAYVLDARQEPVPVGVPGELWVGGAHLARGYLNQPELTAEKFVRQPLGEGGPERLYRTGDRARFHPDGSLEFLGRLDDQIKLRGYRIEPGEIEAELARHPGVAACLVLVREDVPGQRLLAAYVTPRPGHTLQPAELRQFLYERVPLYLMPAAWVVLPSLPLNSRGKVDRAALPPAELGNAEPAGTPGEPGLTPTETALAQIWCEVIGLETVGRQDDFFDLGGHSVLVTQIISRVRKAFGVELTLRHVFEAPTIGELAGVIEQQLAAQLDRLPEIEAQRLAAHLEPAARE